MFYRPNLYKYNEERQVKGKTSKKKIFCKQKAEAEHASAFLSALKADT
ncbi:hypothetical protein HMPREF9124_2013 [Oribacterium sp. oral taxon 108 str. F0425]|nr:hypothetical protein HMPREF9124_2013 [Oribacterium sp. oral taxon 108 str. F0425]